MIGIVTKIIIGIVALNLIVFVLMIVFHYKDSKEESRESEKKNE